MKQLLVTEFNKLKPSGRNGINSVQMEKLFKELGYKVTRKSIDALAKAGVIKLPAETNFVKGKGRRVEYGIESAIDLMIYCLICGTLQGIGKGLATFDKQLMLAEAKKIAEVGDDDMQGFIAYASIATLLSAKDVIPSTIPLSRRIACATSVRPLMFKVVVLYKFLIKWLKFRFDDVLEDWKVLRREIISNKNMKAFSKNCIKNLLGTELCNKAANANENALSIFSSAKEDVREDILRWADIICIFDNSNGLIGTLAHQWLSSKHGIEFFGTSDDWLLALTILRSK